MPQELPRRRFLQQMAALGLGSAALDRVLPAMSAPRRAQEPSTGQGFRKAVGLGMIQQGSTLKERFQLAAELGYDGVELDAPNNYPLEEVLAAQEASGLTIHSVVDSVHWAKPFSSADAEVRREASAGLEAALRAAKAYGADNVLLVPAVVNGGTSYAEAWHRSIAGIKPLVPLAEELGVSISIEFVWNMFLLSPLEMALYLDQFESEAVGFYLDVGNLIRFGWPLHWIEVLGPRIRRVHVKGYSRKLMNEKGPWSGFNCGIHDGDCEWPAVVKALKAVGYDGWFTAEVGGGERARLEAIAADLDRLMAGE